jgi:hypothetical protein
MSEQIKVQLQGNSGKVLGVLLMALGALLLVGQWFRIDVGHWGWPFFIIVPGVVTFIVGSATEGQTGRPLMIAGSMMAAVGLLLFYQNMTDHWASWAYGWALIAPTAFGVGEIMYGLLKDDPQTVSTGTRLVTIGLVVFFAGAVFFELVLGIGGFGMSAWVWSVVLIGVGAFLVLRNVASGQPKR